MISNIIADPNFNLVKSSPYTGVIMSFLDIKDHTNGFNLVCKSIQEKYHLPGYFKILKQAVPLMISKSKYLNDIYEEFIKSRKKSKKEPMDWFTFVRFWTKDLKNVVQKYEKKHGRKKLMKLEGLVVDEMKDCAYDEYWPILYLSFRSFFFYK